MFEEDLAKEKKKNESERTKKAETTNYAEFLAAGKTLRAIFWRTSGFKERTFDCSGFSWLSYWLRMCLCTRASYMWFAWAMF